VVATGIIAMLITLIAYHLGFFDAILSVASKIAKCGKCATFWTTFAVLTFTYRRPVAAIVVAFLVAYVSYWVLLIFGEIDLIYDYLWENQQKRRQRRNGKSK
jgi:hypothetical protein